MDNYINYVKDFCISCGLCNKACPFLNKYEITLKDFAERPNLAFSCFECDKCKDVCPKDLSGKKLSQIFRKEKPAYFLKKKEKENYSFKNVPKTQTHDLLFLGCNFPAFYPKTTGKLKDIFKSYGQSFSIDCCGKPIEYTGYSYDFKKHINEDLKKRGVKRVIPVCPHCYEMLDKYADCEVLSIYEWLEEKNLLKKITKKVNIFFPCPDRYSREIFATIEKYLDTYTDAFKDTNCCGAGGLAKNKEPQIFKKFSTSINKEEVYTYCATCSSNFYKNNQVHHLLSVFLGLDEACDPHFFKNALKEKLRS